MNAMISRIHIPKHKTILSSILLDISKNNFLKKSLVFKWGTSLMFLCNLDRFSTDLDFDMVEGFSKKNILEEFEKILWKYGTLKDIREKRNTLFALLSYGEIDHNIKIEISTRWVSGVWNMRNFMGIELQVLEIPYITANKFLTLMARDKLANRDIYDIHFILKNRLEIEKKHIEKISGKKFPEYIKEMIIFLEKLPKNYNILDGLWVTLNEKQKSFVKKDLISETIFFLHALI